MSLHPDLKALLPPDGWLATVSCGEGHTIIVGERELTPELTAFALAVVRERDKEWASFGPAQWIPDPAWAVPTP